jgi:hypothetical protein
LSDVCMFACQHELCSNQGELLSYTHARQSRCSKSFSRTIVSSSISARCAGDCILADTYTITVFAYLTRLGFALIHGEHAGYEWDGTIVRPI